MGERAVIQLKSGDELSPALYLHWDGRRVAKLLEQTQKVMIGRPRDVIYSFARLVHLAVSLDPEGNTGYGVWNELTAITTADSHGDAGCFLVDVSGEAWTVKQGGGYGLELPHNFKVTALQ